MKKILLLSVLFSLTSCAFGQFKYKEGAKFYVDAGVQITRFSGFKLAASRRVNNMVSVGLAMTKPIIREELNLGLETKVFVRSFSHRAGALLHGAYYKSVISPENYESLSSYEIGFGGIIDDFSFTLAAKNYLGQIPESQKRTYVMLQLTHHFGSIAPEFKGLNNPNYSAEVLARKIRKREKRLYGHGYFDISLGKSVLLINFYRNRFYFRDHLSVSLGVQKNPWMGIGLNYAIHNVGTSINSLKSFGISWRARPKKGFYKISINMINRFRFQGSHIWDDGEQSVYRTIKKHEVPVGVSLEGGVRIFEVFLLKAGCSYYLPYNVELYESFRNDSIIPTVKLETTSNRDIYLGYFHVGIGLIL